MHITIADKTAMLALAARIAATLRRGDCLLLDGPYGAGKTFLARGIICHLLNDPSHEVPSPSFALVQTYDTPHFMLHHFDLWRLGSANDLTEIGFWDSLRDVVLVEWPEKLDGQAPQGALHLHIAMGEGEERTLTLTDWDEIRLQAVFS